MTESETSRRRNLTAALGFLQLPPRAQLRLLHRWIDTWTGVGALTAGLNRLRYDLSLIQHSPKRSP